MPRLVATDLDGTLLRPDGTVSPRTAAALARATARGATVVLVTGRPPRRLPEVATGLACHPLAVCANGALVLEVATGAVVHHHPIDPTTAAAAVARLRAVLPEAVFAVERPERFGHEPGYPLAFAVPEDTVVARAEELVVEGATKLLARLLGGGGDELAPETLLDQAATALGDLVEVSTSSRDGLLEMAAPGVTKAFALAGLAGELGVAAEETVAFGDMLNDLPMLEWAGHAVATANAHRLVREAADEVTASCDEDGVALVLERIFPAPT